MNNSTNQAATVPADQNKYLLTGIINLLNPDNTVSVNRPLAHAIGMNEALIYSALVSKQTFYVQSGQIHEGGWFYSTVKDLFKSTTCGIKAQKTAISKLIAHGLIECKKMGMPAVRFFRIIEDTDRLKSLLDEGMKICDEISNRTEYVIPPKELRGTVETVEKNDIIPSGDSREDVTSESPTAVSSDTQQGVLGDSRGRYKSKVINPKSENPKLKSIYPSGADSEKCSPYAVEKIEDRLIEFSKNKSFAEIVEAVGGNVCEIGYFIPTSENDLFSLNEKRRNAHNLTIPYILKNNKRNMVTALKFLCAFSYYVDEDTDTGQREFYNTVLETIAEMVKDDYCTVKNQRVPYHEIIDRLNDIIHTDSLADWLFSFEEKWKTVLAENKIKHQRAYMRSCIWNWLCEYRFEQYNDERQIPRTFTLKLTDTDVQFLYGRAAAHGITVEELLENFVTDLVDGAACSDWDNYETANEYFDSRYYSPYQYPTLLAFLIRERLLSAFYDILEANGYFEQKIKYLRASRKLSAEEKNANIVYFTKCLTENKQAIGEIYSEYCKRNPRSKSLENEMQEILAFRDKLKSTLSENEGNADED